MTFVVKSTSSTDFDDWVAQVKQSPLQLTESIYNELAKPSLNQSYYTLFLRGKRFI